MSPQSRRRFLQTGAAVGALAVAGCSDVSGGTREAAQRQVETPVQPSDETWPTSGYDHRNTRYASAASPPSESPTTDWSVPIDGVVTAVVVGPDYVYASSTEETVAVAPDGTEQWRAGVGGGLSYIDHRLYVSADDLVALDAASGREVWRGLTGEPDPGGVYEAKGTVYVTSNGGFYGLHSDSGGQRWRIETARYPGLVADERRVGLVTNEQVRFFAPGEVDGGLLENTRPRVTETIRSSWRPDVYSATLLDDTLFVPQYGDRLLDVNAAVRRYNLAVTDERWMTPFTWAGIGTIAVDDECVYAAPYRATTDPPEGSLVALDRKRGTERWRYDGAMLGTPAVGGAVVIAGGADPGSPSVCVSSDSEDDSECSDGKPPAESGVLHAFDTRTGERLWTIQPGASHGGYPLALAEGRVYYGDATGVHALV
ncbi:PQQ-binding-like beta-propeller repeat protein [Natronomonas halophila]|uniref:outer membrane protein assembly factor BamB family protein n=1 Tax=Natronomonas halophila TaxID=2747817 RepID=UPI0015B41593|nr:PQQ-binding-like beta-propeller repeat protein [Natronomonas halophila]QLD84737.1 PQQ-binding-like beta-propeller repeat protein [Natronomonas halophila]